MTGTTLDSHSSNQASQSPGTSISAGKASFWQLGISGVLVLVLVAFLIRLGGVAFSSQLSVTTNQNDTLPESSDQSVDIARLQSGQIFGTGVGGASASFSGDMQEGNLNNPPAADETALNLRLEGVITGSSESKGLAIIVSNNQAASYHVNDRLPVGNTVVLDSIYSDRVILEHNGKMETLWLYDQEPESTLRASAPTPAQSNTLQSLKIDEGYDPIALVNEYRERILKNPRSAEFLTLSEIVRISPSYENNQMMGYLLSPGEHRTEFLKLGLKTNDIVTRINGIELTDIANMPQLFDVMTTASDVTLGLSRNGQPLDLQLSLSELSR